MLIHLSIENYILIRYLEIDFSDGFTVITGETGAGKSILVGALGLITGQRADTSALGNKEKKCIIEGQFNIRNYGFESFFQDNDIDFEPVVTLRREINNQGKSRAFINDTPVNLTELKVLGEKLVDVHSQHQTLQLNEASFQLSLVDSYTHQDQLLAEFGSLYNHFVRIRHELSMLEEAESKASEERDYQQFLFDELENAHLVSGEQQTIEEEIRELSHAEEIKTRLFQALMDLSDSEHNILGMLSAVQQNLEAASRFKNSLAEPNERLKQCYVELKDITGEISQLPEHIFSDPTRMEELHNRLSLIYHLQQKHHVNGMEHLMQLHEKIGQRLMQMDTLQVQIENTRQELKELHARLTEKAELLSRNRINAGPFIEKEMVALLQQLGMPSASFTVKIEQNPDFNRLGKDVITFLFSANRGSEPQPISKIASGGELSRIMLALKSLILNKGILPTILFDEIDTGVSGEIAGKVGGIMKRMSSNLQVITITHLPQIAGKADQHYLAFKEDGSGETIANLRLLDPDERIDEIARIMSNEIITDHARAAARELMNS